MSPISGASSTSPVNMIAFFSTRSITPWNASSSPSTIWTGTALAPSRSRMSATTRVNDAPIRSSLLMNARRGTLNLSPWCQTVSDWGWTPATPQNTTTAPSRTRSERSTSIVKST